MRWRERFDSIELALEELPEVEEKVLDTRLYEFVPMPLPDLVSRMLSPNFESEGLIGLVIRDCDCNGIVLRLSIIITVTIEGDSKRSVFPKRDTSKLFEKAFIDFFRSSWAFVKASMTSLVLTEVDDCRKIAGFEVGPKPKE
ncbi:hypothetical protein Tco_0842090 [Tanacetum coccineum]|uniref:Uncharacterized protein n=1 Tax=Tanacetum coccineum TaxID=301880 RepID=A0ABQ5AZK0_9ASTR